MTLQNVKPSLKKTYIIYIVPLEAQVQSESKLKV